MSGGWISVEERVPEGPVGESDGKGDVRGVDPVGIRKFKSVDEKLGR